MWLTDRIALRPQAPERPTSDGQTHHCRHRAGRRGGPKYECGTAMPTSPRRERNKVTARDGLRLEAKIMTGDGIEVDLEQRVSLFKGLFERPHQTCGPEYKETSQRDTQTAAQGKDAGRRVPSGTLNINKTNPMAPSGWPTPGATRDIPKRLYGPSEFQSMLHRLATPHNPEYGQQCRRPCIMLTPRRVQSRSWPAPTGSANEVAATTRPSCDISYYHRTSEHRCLSA